MAIIRMAASAGAALIALTAIVPTASQAQGPGAPLELVPGSNQARSTPRAAINSKKAATPVAKAAAKTTPNKTTPNKATPKKATRASVRQNTAATQPAPKAARANSRTATISVANDRRQTGPHAPLARYAYPQPVIRQAVVPYLAISRPVLRRGTREPPIIARGASVEAPQDHVMRGRDSVSLVALLPWWRNDRMQVVNYGSAEAESKVLEAAAVWLATHPGEPEDDDPAGVTVARSDLDEAIEVADATEVNEIDRAAEPASSVPSPTFMQSLLAVIVGAAKAAATAVGMLFA